MSPRRAAASAVGCALLIVLLWFVRRAPGTETITEATVAISVTRHDTFGAPSKPLPVRERAAVLRILDALGVDELPADTCPADYATADVGLLFSGRDVYARRNAYVWNLNADAPRVVLVDETGCRAGIVHDAVRLRTALAP